MSTNNDNNSQCETVGCDIFVKDILNRVLFFMLEQNVKQTLHSYSPDCMYSTVQISV